MEQIGLFDEKHECIKCIGINGYEFFFGEDSVMHDYMKQAKVWGVKCEKILTNYSHSDIPKNLNNLVVYKGIVNKNKIATSAQSWALSRLIINELRNPCFPTPNITRETCA